MQIVISDSKGKKITIDNLSDSTKVKDLKQKIINTINVTILPIELTHNANILEDELTLEDYDIKDNDCIICYAEFIAGFK